mgnify:FL=1
MESFDPRCTLGDGIGKSLRNMGISRTETRRKVEELLERYGLEKEYADRYPQIVYLSCVWSISDRVADRAEMSEAILFVKDISAFWFLTQNAVKFCVSKNKESVKKH